MELQEARFIRNCLPQGRTLFPYYKDYYALYLLAQAAGEGHPLHALRGSPFGRLLQKPVVKERLAQLGGKRVRRDDFLSHWPVAPEYFRLTLGLWGEEKRSAWSPSYEQTVRPGVNLVLQLNFSFQHNRWFDTSCKSDFLLNDRAHPNSIGNKECTLAWCRLDVDLDCGEVLIEEVQTDWLKCAAQYRQWLRGCAERGEDFLAWVLRRRGFEGNAADIFAYLDGVLQAYQKLWDQAILCAALWFIREELGIRRVFFHHFETKRLLLKMNKNWAPPKSLYTTLPRAFCFQLQQETPRMLHKELGRAKTKRRCPEPQFYLLEL